MGTDAVEIRAQLPYAHLGERRSTNELARPPGLDWRQFKVSISSQLQSYVRTSRFWVIFGIVLGLGGLLTLVGSHGAFASTSAGYIFGVTTFVPYLAIVAGALFGGDAISTDFGTKTGYYMLPIPVRRSVLLTGRYVAAFIASLVVMGTYYGIVVLGSATIYPAGSVPWGDVGLAFALVALLMLGILSFAFALSSMSKSPAFGLVLTIMVLLVVFLILDAIVGGLFGPNYLWFSILYASGATEQVVLSGVSATGPSVGQAVVITAGYAAGFFGMALALFDREEA